MISRVWHGWTTPSNADAYDTPLKNEIFTGIKKRKIAATGEFISFAATLAEK